LASITTAWGWKQIDMVYIPGLQNPISAERQKSAAGGDDLRETRRTYSPSAGFAC